MDSELDTLQAALTQAEERARTSTAAALAINHKVQGAQAARDKALARVAELEAGRDATTLASNGAASSGTAALLRAALNDSQRKLSLTQKQYAAASKEIETLRAEGVVPTLSSHAAIVTPSTTSSHAAAAETESSGPKSSQATLTGVAQPIFAS